MRITYVGHSTVMIETAGGRLLTDPILRSRILHLRRIAPLRDLDELRAPDAVLISHAHLDHLDLRSLRMLDDCRVVAPTGCGRLLRRAGVRDVTELAPGEKLRMADAEVMAIELTHDGRRHPLSRARDTLGYLITADETVFFAGDTAFFDGMRELPNRLDVALLPVWGWGPRVGAGHMDPAEAARAAALIQPRLAIPIHWGTLASPRVHWIDDPERPAREFVREARAAGVGARLIRPGGSIELPAEP
jgi:L-ascorbate metabolism protein UlaG (beta-lactamase superfamily)